MGLGLRSSPWENLVGREGNTKKVGPALQEEHARLACTFWLQVYAAKRAAAMRADEQAQRDGGGSKQGQRKRKQAA